MALYPNSPSGAEAGAKKALEAIEGDAYAIVFPYDISYFDCADGLTHILDLLKPLDLQDRQLEVDMCPPVPDFRPFFSQVPDLGLVDSVGSDGFDWIGMQRIQHRVGTQRNQMH